MDEDVVFPSIDELFTIRCCAELVYAWALRGRICDLPPQYLGQVQARVAELADRRPPVLLRAQWLVDMPAAGGA